MKRVRSAAAFQGFTLVEIMVVIAILAILGLVGVTAARGVLQKARITGSIANLRSLAIAGVNYEADNGIYCPADDQYNTKRWHGSREGGSGKFDPTKGFLSPYLGESRQVTVCPIFKEIVSGPASFENGTGGYGYNAAYIGGKPGSMFDRATRLRISERRANVPDPARTVMFTTTAYAQADGLQEYPYCEPPFWDFGSGPSSNRPSPTVHFRANGKALVAWCDGSVTQMAMNDTSSHGENPHGGDSHAFELGWFGPERDNGYWNPKFR